MDNSARYRKMIAFLLTCLTLLLLPGVAPAGATGPPLAHRAAPRGAVATTDPCLPGQGPTSKGMRPVGPRQPGAVAAPPAAPALADGAWTNFHPDLNTISALTPTNVWAAGEYGHLLHYTGAWTAVDPPEL